MTFGLVLCKIYKLLSSQDNIFLLQCSRNRHVVMPNGFISPAGHLQTFFSFQSSPTSILYTVHCQLYSYIYIFNNIYSEQGYLKYSIMYMYNVHVLYSFFKSSNYSTWYFLTVSYLPFSCMGSLLIWEVSQIFFIKNNPAHLAEVPQGDST